MSYDNLDKAVIVVSLLLFAVSITILVCGLITDSGDTALTAVAGGTTLTAVAGVCIAAGWGALLGNMLRKKKMK